MAEHSYPLKPAAITQFQDAVYHHYQRHGRQLSWRIPEANGQFDPYKILVSEIMLQQTQVARVEPKYNAFLELFPTVQALAQAPLSNILTAWSGLGYNRRARYLQLAAQIITAHYKTHWPQTIAELVKLPGVGPNTAAAVLVYSFNLPLVFIETNIRSAYLHHFFQTQTAVADRELLPLITATLDTNQPRLWYWALMDYGSYLKSAMPNPSQRSKHHTVQSTFHGSRRQLRGQVLKKLIDSPKTAQQLQQTLDDERLISVLDALVHEGLVSKAGSIYQLGR